MPVGLVLAIILIYVINLRSFGWTLQMHLQTMEFFKAFAVAVSSALMAGIYPAWQLSRIPVIDALRSE
jgi:putative ABC transport system permease protein